MRKQVRQYLRRSLCGILSAAMILTGSIIPDISVLAAQPAVEDTVENNDADVQVDETPSVENDDAVQNPDAVDGNIDSSEGDENVPEQPEENISEGDDVASPVENTIPGDEENEGDSEGDNTVDGNIKDGDATNGVADDDDVEEVSDEVIAVTADNNKSYTEQEVTLNYYIKNLGEDATVGFYPWSDPDGEITVDASLELGWKAWTDKTVYEMKSVVGSEGWYNITFKVTDTLTLDDDGKCTKALAGFNIVTSSEPNKKDGIFACSGWTYQDIYKGLLDGTITAVKDGEGYVDIAAAEAGETTGNGKYTDQPVTLNYYVGDLDEGETVGFYKWVDTNGKIEVDTSENQKLPWGTWGKPDENPVYQMNSVEGHAGWYHIDVKVTDTITSDGGLVSLKIYRSTADSDALFECDAWSNTDIYKGLLDGEIIAVRDGKGYASIEEAVKAPLKELVAKAKKLNQEDYKEEGWQEFSDALKMAEEVLEKENAADNEIEKAYEILEMAMDALVRNSLVEAEINVKPIALADDFITGADISSYLSLYRKWNRF